MNQYPRTMQANMTFMTVLILNNQKVHKLITSLKQIVEINNTKIYSLIKVSKREEVNNMKNRKNNKSLISIQKLILIL